MVESGLCVCVCVCNYPIPVDSLDSIRHRHHHHDESDRMIAFYQDRPLLRRDLATTLWCVQSEGENVLVFTVKWSSSKCRFPKAQFLSILVDKLNRLPLYVNLPVTKNQPIIKNRCWRK